MVFKTTLINESITGSLLNERILSDNPPPRTSVNYSAVLLEWVVARGGRKVRLREGPLPATTVNSVLVDCLALESRDGPQTPSCSAKMPYRVGLIKPSASPRTAAWSTPRVTNHPGLLWTALV